jgi:hypothetical protein
MPARIHLKDASGKPFQPPQLPFWRDHFVCAGEAQVELLAGDYSIEVERGPEFSAHKNTFVVPSSGATNIAIALERIADLASEGWWSGGPARASHAGDAELLMRAEDLHVAQFITWWNSRTFGAMRRQGILCGSSMAIGSRTCSRAKMNAKVARLLYFNLKQPLAITDAARHFPSSLVYATEARKHAGVWIDMEKPFWWGLPALARKRLCDSVGLANNHMNRGGMLDNEAWGKPRDRERFPSPAATDFGRRKFITTRSTAGCAFRHPPAAHPACCRIRSATTACMCISAPT